MLPLIQILLGYLHSKIQILVVRPILEDIVQLCKLLVNTLRWEEAVKQGLHHAAALHGDFARAATVVPRLVYVALLVDFRASVYVQHRRLEDCGADGGEGQADNGAGEEGEDGAFCCPWGWGEGCRLCDGGVVDVFVSFGHVDGV